MFALCLAPRTQTNFHFRKGFPFGNAAHPRGGCRVGGFSPSNAVRIAESGEVVLTLVGFRCVRAMRCPSSETRVVLTKEFLLMNAGFLYVRTMPCPSSGGYFHIEELVSSICRPHTRGRGVVWGGFEHSENCRVAKEFLLQPFSKKVFAYFFLKKVGKGRIWRNL